MNNDDDSLLEDLTFAIRFIATIVGAATLIGGAIIFALIIAVIL